jgi:hypothetical protein
MDRGSIIGALKADDIFHAEFQWGKLHLFGAVCKW